MADAVSNFAFSTVATAPSPATTGTSLVVASGDGTLFPTAPFNAVVYPSDADPSATNAEIVRVTAVSTDTLTITREQESTSARTIVTGDRIHAGVTAALLDQFATTDGAQTLTNKEHTNPDITDQTLTDGATINWNCDNGSLATVTLGGNRTMAAPTNLNPGTYVLKVIQDATGSRTITWNSVFKWAGGTAPTLSTGNGDIDIITFVCDGTNLYGVASLNFS